MSPNRGPTDFGSRLRAARERRGISLRKISDATKISVGVLEALERNDFSRLPGGIFSRAFIRSYAAEVGLDPDETIEDFLAQLPAESPAAVVHHAAEPIEDRDAIESDRRLAATVLRLIIISVPIAGAMLYFGMRGMRPRPTQPTEPASASAPASSTAPSAEAPTPIETPPAPAVVVPAPSDAPGTTPAAVAASAPPAPAPAAAPAPSSTPAAERPAATGTAQPAAPAARESIGTAVAPAMSEVGERLTIAIATTRPCWVSATVDGQKTIERLLQAGEQHTIEVHRELVITAGDASALTLTVNGTEAKPLGKAGQVVTARLNLTNFKDYLPQP